MCTEWFIVGGTFVLATVALLQDHIRSWITTPKLEIETEASMPYCMKLLFIHPNNPNIKADGYGLRVAVKNKTPFLRVKSRAISVEVFASKLLRKEQDNHFYPVQGFEPTNLIWSHSFMPSTDISPDMIRFCFIGRMIKPSARKEFPDFNKENLPKNKTCLRIDTHLARHTKGHIISAGTYRLELLIGAANTKAINLNFEIKMTGDWYDDEVEMFEKGLCIKMTN